MGNVASSEMTQSRQAELPEALTSAEIFDEFERCSLRAKVRMLRERGVEFVIGKREGAYLWNAEGDKRVVDCGTSGGVHSLGHCNQEVADALVSAIQSGKDAGLWGLPNYEYVKFCKDLCVHAPCDHLNRALVTLSSTVSNDVAIMSAFRMTGRRKILAYQHGYHGHSGFAALITGSLEEGVIEHFRLPKDHSAFGDSYGNIERFRRDLTSEVAAVILEPMNYETFAPAPEGYLAGVVELCRENGSLFILDETRSGLGRCGTLWAASLHSVRPDYLITGKGLSGGIYPVSAVVMREEIFEESFNTHKHAYISSLGGNELSCVVGSKVLEISSRADFLANVLRISESLGSRLQSVCEEHPNIVRFATIQGMMATVEVFDRHTASMLYTRLFDSGVLAHSVSTISPFVIKLFPPLTINEGIVEEICDVFARALKEIS
jgi:acetylornithine aminotransferase